MNPTPEYVIVIPCRFESRRLPGKALLDINGKSLLRHAWDRASAAGASEVVIATDNARIRDAAEAFGASVVMTSPQHTCGSDRIAECAQSLEWPGERIIVNLQGDEPLMPPPCLDQVAGLLAADAAADAATLYWPVESVEEAMNPNVVKVVAGANGDALLFSRATIPWPRDHDSIQAAFDAGVRWHRHLGLYAYRAASLQRFANTGPTPLEQVERLEQLRFLEMGGSIKIAQAYQRIPAGVDTPEDLRRIRNIIKSSL